MLVQIISHNPASLLGPHAVREFVESGGWRLAEVDMRNLIMPFAPHLTAEHVRQVARATLAAASV